MAVAVKKSDKHWAFCRYHLRLSDKEIKTLTMAQFNELKRLHEEDKIERIKFFEKLVARVIFFGYLLNTERNKRNIDNAEDFMFFGEKRKSDKIDLTTDEGMVAFAKYLDKMVAK